MARRTMWLMAAVLCAGAAWGKPVSEEAVKAANESMNKAVDAMRAAGGISQDGLAKAADEALADIAIDSLSMDQIEALERALAYTSQGEALRARLKALAGEPTGEGARAAVKVVVFMDEETSAADQAAALRAAIGHAGLKDAFTAGKGFELFMQAAYAKQEALVEIAPSLGSLAGMLNKDMPIDGVIQAQNLLSGMLNAGDSLSSAAGSLRTKLVELSEAALPTAEGRTKERLTRTLEFLNGAFAKGTLVGNVTPELTIEWSSDPAIRSMEDLRGKVVVIDFWATWCGPCIRSFPNVRDLVKHYEGYPVTVLGVTSIQGRHYPKGGSPIDCKDDPAKERSLMTGLMQDHEMTWPVVFTKQNVFNPDYGVNGIPHVAILDPNGVVRYRGMHPASDAAEKHAKIDGLLKEFNLPAPPEH